MLLVVVKVYKNFKPLQIFSLFFQTASFLYYKNKFFMPLEHEYITKPMAFHIFYHTSAEDIYI